MDFSTNSLIGAPISPALRPTNTNSAGSDNSSVDGLKITDTFGDEIRDLQEQAAQEQMAYQTQSAERAMQFSADEAQKNRDWQERMSNTAYQRAVSDMKNAGLNPILAAGGSSMASSTPAGASASGIAQSGSQAQVSEYNSGLAALEVYLDAIVSIVGSASSLVGKSFHYDNSYNTYKQSYGG